MNERFVPPAGPAPIHAEPMQKLADKLTSLVPPLAAAPLVEAGLPKPSAAVTAALEKSAKRAALAARKAAKRSRPLSVRLIESFNAACGFIPYALVALALRLVMARVFLMDAQVKFRGPQVSFGIYDFDFSVMIPAELKAPAIAAFSTSLPQLPVPSSLIAYAVSYGEFILPLMLIVGLGTRFAALSLIGITALMAVYLTPHALMTAHIYWGAMLLVLVSLGGGVLSIDALLRRAVRR